MLQSNNWRGTHLTIPIHRGIVIGEKNEDASVGRKFLMVFMPLIILTVVLMILVIFSPEKHSIQSYRGHIASYFPYEGGVLLYQSGEGEECSDPYGGRLGADGYDEWSFNGSEHLVWCGYYEDAEELDWVVSGISEDGSSLMISSGADTSASLIEPNVNRRIYRTDNILLYYDGGVPEVYTVLERLCDKPIADGSRQEKPEAEG